MEFEARVVDSSGVRRTVRRTAPDAAALRAALKADGMVVAAIAPAQRAARRRGAAGTSFFGMTALDAEMGLRQIASMLRSGVTLLAALQTAAGQSTGRGARRTWQDIAARVERGATLSDSLAAHARRFGETAVRLADVGERTGELANTLGKAADQMETRRNLRASMINALMYPSIAVVMALAVSAYLVAAVIPRLASFLVQGGVELPAITQMLMDFSAAVRENAPWIAACAALAVVLWFVLRIPERTREMEDAALLRLPVAGWILRLAGTALFARAMQIMTESGVALTDSLAAASRLFANRRLRRRVSEACDAVVKGRALDEAFAGAVEFTPMMRKMAGIGSAGGALPEAFGEAARFHEMLLALAVKRLGMLIEPVMICATGGIVGFVYIAFFSALFSIAGIN